MQTLEERQAARKQRDIDNRAPVSATRDDLQAAAEDTVAMRDTAAGLTSAPLAAKAGGAAKGKAAAKKAAAASPFGA